MQTLATGLRGSLSHFFLFVSLLSCKPECAYKQKKASAKLKPRNPSCPLRRERDSNPRNSCPFTAFRVRPDRPLRHLSNCECKYRDNFFIRANFRSIFFCFSVFRVIYPVKKGLRQLFWTLNPPFVGYFKNFCTFVNEKIVPAGCNAGAEWMQSAETGKFAILN